MRHHDIGEDEIGLLLLSKKKSFPAVDGDICGRLRYLLGSRAVAFLSEIPIRHPLATSAGPLRRKPRHPKRPALGQPCRRHAAAEDARFQTEP
jgi:hypothetical protein